jgi:hypothetical protein
MLAVVLSFLGCSGGEGPTVEPPPSPPTPPAEDGPLPEQRVGVFEVSTPPSVVRATEVQDRAAVPRLDVWFEPTTTSFDALGARLSAWGFSILDGDGESWRVGPPLGTNWPARLLPLPEVANVTEAVDPVVLETGAVREGSERYGELVHRWSWGEGGPTQSVTGGAAPPEPKLPHALPTHVVRCLAPVRAELATGVSVGIGWERAYIAQPRSWVLLVEDYGACRATGWLVLRPDASVDNLQVAGRPVADVDDATLYAAAIDYLRVERPLDDAAAVSAWDLLRGAPTDTLAGAVALVAPGPHQERLWQELDQRDSNAALSLAEASESPNLRAQAAAESEQARAAILADGSASASALLATMNVWRPGPDDPPGLMERLRAHPSPRVRERAWEITAEVTAAACDARAATLGAADVTAVSAIYRECPQQTVRVSAFNRLSTLDAVAASAVVRVVLEEPETTRTGILAARQAAALERYDLLEALVRRQTVGRDVRRVALELMVRGQQPQTAELIEQHGSYLGYRAPGASVPTTADGAP